MFCFSVWRVGRRSLAHVEAKLTKIDTASQKVIDHLIKLNQSRTGHSPSLTDGESVQDERMAAPEPKKIKRDIGAMENAPLNRTEKVNNDLEGDEAAMANDRGGGSYRRPGQSNLSGRFDKE